MEEGKQQGTDRFGPISSHDAAGTAGELHNGTEQVPLAQKDERTVSANPSPDSASISGASRNNKARPATSRATGAHTSVHPLNSYVSQEHGYYIGGSGYNNGPANWDEHANYVNTSNLHVIPPGMYNDNSSFYFSPGFGFDAYGQFSPIASPLSPILIDGQGQFFSPHQVPMTPSYYTPSVSPGPTHVSSGLSASQGELPPMGNASQETLVDNAYFGPGSGYYLPFGSFGTDSSGDNALGLYNIPGDFWSKESVANHSNTMDANRFMSPLNPGAMYPQPIGILGSYEQNAGQTPFQGFGQTSNSSAIQFARVGSYQSIGSGSSHHRFDAETDGRRERNRDSSSLSTDNLGDRNRGPRAMKVKSKSSSGGQGPLALEYNGLSITDPINHPNFITDYKHAKFFVIKSFSEDNIHKSIKYGVWASTPLGNRKLDAAYREAKEIEGSCPIFLFFSVNASGQFCGVAEMVGPIDFDRDADYWLQDRWNGQFPVKWHIVKDVPNSFFRHIILENNENKPVTHSRDSQEVKLEKGIEMLKIFKNHVAETSLLDDFEFYDKLEKTISERKAKQRAIASTTATNTTSELINQLSDNMSGSLNLNSSRNVPNPSSQ